MANRITAKQRAQQAFAQAQERAQSTLQPNGFLEKWGNMYSNARQQEMGLAGQEAAFTQSQMLNAEADQQAATDMIPGMQQGLLIDSKVSGFNKGSGALLGIREAMSKAESPAQMAELEAQAQQIMQSPQFNPQAAAGQQQAQAQAETAQRQANVNVAEGEMKLNAARSGTVSPLERTNVINTWHDDWYNNTALPREVMEGAAKMTNLLQQNNSLASLAAVTSFAKILDPGSVVRTEEGRMVATGTGMAEYVAGEYNKLLGKGMTDKAKGQFRQTLNAVVLPYAQELTNITGSYEALAQKNDIDPNDLFRGQNEQAMQTAKGFMGIDMSKLP